MTGTSMFRRALVALLSTGDRPGAARRAGVGDEAAAGDGRAGRLDHPRLQLRRTGLPHRPRARLPEELLGDRDEPAGRQRSANGSTLSFPGPLTAYNDAVSGARAVNLLGQAEVAASSGPRLRPDRDRRQRRLRPAGTHPDRDLPRAGPIGARSAGRGEPEGLHPADEHPRHQPTADDLHRTAGPERAARAGKLFNVCQGLLANPLSTEPADEERRAAFRDQVIAYNDALAEVCAEFKRCRWDDYAVFNSGFTTADVATVQSTRAASTPALQPDPVFGPGNANSTADYFHPSISGQARLAEAAWSTTFNDWSNRKGGAAALAAAQAAP